MGRFLAFLLVFVIGAVVGVAGGGLLGVAGGAYVGACKVIDQAVTSNAMTQDQANTLVKSIADQLEISKDRKDRIVEQLKKGDLPPSPCATAIQGL